MKDIFSNIRKEPSAKILRQVMQEVAIEAKEKAILTNKNLLLSVKDEVRRLQLKYKF
jgi:hypothetical protein